MLGVWDQALHTLLLEPDSPIIAQDPNTGHVSHSSRGELLLLGDDTDPAFGTCLCTTVRIRDEKQGDDNKRTCSILHSPGFSSSG